TLPPITKARIINLSSPPSPNTLPLAKTSLFRIDLLSDTLHF
ncbi:hypothetical protein A2U01_0086238, partial [Trifolium medium]|nr:hypothetical protein [Trifolium medium]